jgi:hypothetical protein
MVEPNPHCYAKTVPLGTAPTRSSQVLTGAQLARTAWWIATPLIVLDGACDKVCVER